MQPILRITQGLSDVLASEKLPSRKPIPEVRCSEPDSLSTSDFCNLPPDVLRLIFAYLNEPADRCFAARVCRKFREFAYEPTYWQFKAKEFMDELCSKTFEEFQQDPRGEIAPCMPDLDFRYEEALPDQARQRYINLVLWSQAKELRSEAEFIKFINRFSCATEFYLHRFSVINPQVLQILTTHVQALTVFEANPLFGKKEGFIEFNGSHLIAMVQAHPEIQILELMHCPKTTPKDLVEIVRECPRLRELKVDCKDAEKKGLSGAQIEQIGTVLKELELLSIYNSQDVDDRALTILLRSNPKLHHVRIAGCSLVTEAAFKVFAERENFQINISGLSTAVEQKLNLRLHTRPSGTTNKVIIEHEYPVHHVPQALPTPQPKKAKTSLFAPLRRLIKGK